MYAHERCTETIEVDLAMRTIPPQKVSVRGRGWEEGQKVGEDTRQGGREVAAQKQ